MMEKESKTSFITIIIMGVVTLGALVGTGTWEEDIVRPLKED